MKMVLKGILAWEDAKIAAEAGIDAIIVSNHGGRADESGRSTIEILPEIMQVSGNMPVLIDSGFRRGTDIVKALCMGAKGVAVGRPYLWGLGAFGQAGVERVLRYPAHRAHGRHAAGRRAVAQGSQAVDGGEGVKQTSCRDRLEQALARIADPKGEGERACLTVYADAARAAADAADARAARGVSLGPLDGAIVSIKDLFDVAGEPTRAGSKILAEEAAPAVADAAIVRRLRAAAR